MLYQRQNVQVPSGIGVDVWFCGYSRNVLHMSQEQNVSTWGIKGLGEDATDANPYPIFGSLFFYFTFKPSLFCWI